MVDHLNHVAVGDVNVGVVLSDILAAPLIGVGAPDVPPGTGCRRPHVRDAQLVQVREHRLPVIHLEREVAGGNRGRMVRFGEMDLAVAETQLQLPLVERRAAIQEVRSKHLLVPLPRPRSIADLNVDVMDHLYLSHTMASTLTLLQGSHAASSAFDLGCGGRPMPRHYAANRPPSRSRSSRSLSNALGGFAGVPAGSSLPIAIGRNGALARARSRSGTSS